jgi:hypothetical protein
MAKPELQRVATLEHPTANGGFGAEEPREQAIERDLTTEAL